MKRNVIFLSILTVLTISVMASGFLYTKDFKSALIQSLERCTDDDFLTNIDKAEQIVLSKKHVITLLCPKDTMEEILISIKQAKALFIEGKKADAVAQMERARVLASGLY